ncbi:cell division protein ZapA [Thiobacillus sedimenti]|uniref:Cell division protein ZapA n=1 Tax=Thiobacillus sedimenti TaxID=3110231 RepID=A0ABZ1CII7_9PROT|nr:cell division protein ZapA [Thiobacillus sp. SCUT-2]WRS39189.1 cell division protein ZapA [Thiobacillus sp. SCUT-2]
MAGPRSIEIHILGRAYKVACSREEESGLLAAADFLDRKMREIRDSSKVIGGERIAIMAGLNLAHDLLTQGGGSLADDARARLTHCNALLDAVLEDQDKLF